MSQTKNVVSPVPVAAWLNAALHRWRLVAAGSAWAGRAWVDCAALVVLALAVRSFGLAGLPLWTDEVFTVYWSQLPLAYLFGAGAHVEANPPVYYAFMHEWMALFGDSALAVHLPSVIFSAATVAVVYATAKTLFDRQTALLAGLLAAVNPFLVAYAQEARTYALLCLANGLAYLALAVYFRFRTKRDARLAPWLALFVAAVSVGVFLHFTSVLFLASSFLLVGLELAVGGPYRPFPFVLWGGLLLLCLAGAAWPVSLGLGLSHAKNISWIPLLTWPQARYFLSFVVLGPVAPAGWACWLGLAAVLAASCRRLGLARAQFLLLVVMPLLFLGIFFAVTAMRPILVPRLAIWLAIPMSILLARAVLRQKYAALRWAAAAIVAASWLVPLGSYFARPGKEDWRTAAAVATKVPQCAGPILYAGNTGLGMIYYNPALGRRPLYSVSMTLMNGVPVAVPVTYLQPDELQTAFLHSQYLTVSDVPGFLSHHPHSMLVLRPVFVGLVLQLPRPTVLGELKGHLVVACY
jgi:mannosyltransferase